MKKFALTSAMVLVCAGMAFAGPESIRSSSKEMKETVAPAPPACDFTWTGFYLGAKGGYGWSDSELHAQFLQPNPTTATISPDNLDLSTDGFVGGGEIGFNWQLGRIFVLGIEADFLGAGLSDGHIRTVDVSDFSPPPVPLGYNQGIDWYGTVRGRIGFAPWCRLLIYGTGGFAYANVDDFADLDYRPVGGVEVYAASRNNTQTGWTGGGGIEFALARHWTIKAEYLYIDVGDQSANAIPVPPNPPYQVHYNWESQFHTVTGGLNFKF
jgi:outer membrane immunogenic protein